MEYMADRFDFKHEHKTWTPEDQMRYEKGMIYFKVKLGALVFLGAILLFIVGTRLLGF